MVTKVKDPLQILRELGEPHCCFCHHAGYEMEDVDGKPGCVDREACLKRQHIEEFKERFWKQANNY